MPSSPIVSAKYPPQLTYGARPRKLLEGDFSDGDRVRVEAEDGELVFRPAPVAVPDVGVA